MFDIIYDFFMEGLEFLKWYFPLYILFAFVGDLIAEARGRRR